MPKPCSNCNGGQRKFTVECWQCNGTGQTEKCDYCGLTRAVAKMVGHECFYMVADTATDDHEAAFRKLCDWHDTSFNFSDDPRYWERGVKEFKALHAYGKRFLTPERAVAIWNEVIDKKFADAVGRKTFHTTAERWSTGA